MKAALFGLTLLGTGCVEDELTAVDEPEFGRLDEDEDDTDAQELGDSSTTGDESRSIDPEFDLAEPGPDADAITGTNRIDDTNTNPRWPNVVAVSTVGGSCSGTLISPVHVLTAGHCGIGTLVRLDTPAGSGAGPLNNRRYTVVQTQILSAALFGGQDLSLMLLDRAVPSYGPTGAPNYAASPAFAIASIAANSVAWTVGYGTDCGGAAFGTRRGLRYSGGWTTYPSLPGVVTRTNLGCGNPAYEGPNTGDSGGPLLDNFGRVVGVFSGWSCRQPSGSIGGSGCTGTIEWSGFSASNVAWLQSAMTQDFDGDGIPDNEDPRPALNCTGSNPPAACAEVRPDLEIIAIANGGCTGPGGDPVVQTTIRNNGPVTARGWVDVFVDLPSAPSVGDYSTVFRMSNMLSMGQTQVMSFAVQPNNLSTWVDVIADTTQTVDETNENNNVRSQFITFSDCSFN